MGEEEQLDNQAEAPKNESRLEASSAAEDSAPEQLENQAEAPKNESRLEASAAAEDSAPELLEHEIRCPGCGTVFSKGDAVCPNCGASRP